MIYVSKWIIFYIFLDFNMPVKKTTEKKPVAHKTTTAKKTTAKKPVAHKTTVHKAVAHKTTTAHKAVAKHSTVTVETKKTTKDTNCVLKWAKCMKTLFIVLLVLNLVFGVLNFMKQDSSLKLEEMKVWGWENLEKVMRLYQSDFYKEQQSAAIQQFMAQNAQQPQQ